MRLWHKELIKVLPRQQLISQWRELCCIAKNLNNKGTPNHILVNKILDYNKIHLICYTKLILQEMKNRNYKISHNSFNNYLINLNLRKEEFYLINLGFDDIFKDWHNNRYLQQCFYNLEEKYDCNGISKEEFEKIENLYKNKPT